MHSCWKLKEVSLPYSRCSTSMKSCGSTQIEDMMVNLLKTRFHIVATVLLLIDILSINEFLVHIELEEAWASGSHFIEDYHQPGARSLPNTTRNEEKKGKT